MTGTVKSASWEAACQNRSADAVSWWQGKHEVWFDLVEDADLPRDSTVVDIRFGPWLLVEALVAAGCQHVVPGGHAIVAAFAEDGPEQNSGLCLSSCEGAPA